MLAVALEAEEAQARALRALSLSRKVLGYRGVDCEGLFGGADAALAQCEATASSLRAHYRQAQQQQQGAVCACPWLAALWGSRGYCEAHALYFRGVVGSYTEVCRTRGSSSGAEAAFSEVEENVLEERTLRQVVLGTVAHMLSALFLAKAQLATARADRAYLAVRALLRAGPGNDVALHAFDEESGVAAVREENERGIKTLEVLARSAAEVLRELRGLDLLDRIDGACELADASRNVVRSDTFAYHRSRELGLSVSIPMLVVVVENGVLAALPLATAGAEKRYRLVRWYPLSALRVFVVPDDDACAVTVAASPQRAQGSSRRWAARHPMSFAAPTRAAQSSWLAVVGAMAPDAVAQEERRSLSCPLLGRSLRSLLELECTADRCDNVPLLLRRLFRSLFRSAGAPARCVASPRAASLGRLSGTFAYADALALLAKQSLCLTQLLQLLKALLTQLPAPTTTPEWRGAAREGRSLRLLQPEHRRVLVQLSCVASSLASSEGQRFSEELELLRGLAGFYVAQHSEAEAHALLGELMLANDRELLAINFAKRSLGHQLHEFATNRRKLCGHNEPVAGLCLTPSGKQVWSIDVQGNLLIWDSQQCRFASRAQTVFRGACTSATVGDGVWVGHAEGIAVLDPERAAPVLKITRVAPVSLLWLEGRGEVWCGCEDRLMVFDSATRKVLHILAADEYRGLTFIALAAASPSCLWSVGFRRTPNPQTEIHVFEAKEGVLVETRRFMTHSSRIASLVAIEGSMWALHEDSTLMIWNTDTCKCIHSLAWGGMSVGDEHKIVIWDARTYGQVGELRGYHTESTLDMLSVSVWSVHNSMFSTTSI
eukprot:m51a1_g7034 hypothetical protein (832) ;mRNA; f:88184-91393